MKLFRGRGIPCIVWLSAGGDMPVKAPRYGAPPIAVGNWTGLCGARRQMGGYHVDDDGVSD
jgi:hypothetical protein